MESRGVYFPHMIISIFCSPVAGLGRRERTVVYVKCAKQLDGVQRKKTGLWILSYSPTNVNGRRICTWLRLVVAKSHKKSIYFR